MWSLVTVLALALTDGNVVGQGKMIKLLASDGGAVQVFGTSVSISGSPGNEIVIIGSGMDDINRRYSGSAYIYRRDGLSWIEEQKLIASDRATNDYFGMSVSISGFSGNGVAIIGASGKSNRGLSSGAAYVFRFNGEQWIEEKKLLASDGRPNAYFGISVSISGHSDSEVAIAGAWGDDEYGKHAGAAYIFRHDPARPGWIEEARLIASGGRTLAEFGYSVSIGGTPGKEVAIVGSRGASTRQGFYSGSAYIYRFNGVEWVEEQILLASDGNHNDYFGHCVAISGVYGSEVAIACANREDSNDVNRGLVYFFRFNGERWIEEQKISIADDTGNNWRAESVSISGPPGKEVAIIGGHVDGSAGIIAGSAYIYRFDGEKWVEEQVITTSDGRNFDAFGGTVSISGTSGSGFAIIGAAADDDNGFAAGAAYVLPLAAIPTPDLLFLYVLVLIIIGLAYAFRIRWQQRSKRAQRETVPE